MINLLDTRLPDRFWSKVQPCPMSGCWLWIGYINGTGYGRYQLTRPRVWFLAHRASYLALVGLIAPTLVIDHLCRVRCCVNPAHLEQVTDAENRRRGTGNPNRHKTHCIHGHEMTVENIYVDRVGKRKCRRCMSDRRQALRTSTENM